MYPGRKFGVFLFRAAVPAIAPSSFIHGLKPCGTEGDIPLYQGCGGITAKGSSSPALNLYFSETLKKYDESVLQFIKLYYIYLEPITPVFLQTTLCQLYHVDIVRFQIERGCHQTICDCMKRLSIIILLLLLSCSKAVKGQLNDEKQMIFTETEILEQLDMAFNGVPSKYYPAGSPEDIKYNFFLDLEHGYCETAGSRIHLYADTTRWVIVFEKSGYQTRENSAEIELNYIGNCIDYPIEKYPERSYISNSSHITLIEPEEFERIENKEGAEIETVELIGDNIKKIKIRDKFVPFDNNYKNYEKNGISISDDENPSNLIGFGDLVRYLHETDPNVLNATEEEIDRHIPDDLPKLMTIDEFHFVSIYDKTNPPSQQETYKLISKILTTKDTANWKPTQKPNNSWKNWESGNL